MALYLLLLGQTGRIGGTAANFSDIDWASRPRYLKTSANQGSGYAVMGTTQIMSVPYSLVANDVAWPVEKLGIKGTTYSRLELGNITQTTTLTNIQQDVTYSSLNISSTYIDGGYVPGFVWRTTDNNPTIPKAGIWCYNDNTGSKLIFGTSNLYNTGITNTALVIDPAGNIGIGTMSPGYKLTVNGTAWCTSGSWTSSDIRWKKNITAITDILPSILKLNPVSYELRAEEFPDMGFVPGEQIGLIAQDLEKVFPQLVNTDNNGYKAIAYDKLSSLLVEAIKEQQEQIESQSEKITRLEKLVEQLIEDKE